MKIWKSKYLRCMHNYLEGMSPADIIKVCDKSKKQHIMYGGKIEKIVDT